MKSSRIVHCLALVAKRLKQRRSRKFCVIVAGVSCLGVPLGTALGISTFVILSRDSVRRMTLLLIFQTIGEIFWGPVIFGVH